MVEVIDRRWGYGERGWTLDERDEFVRVARACEGVNFSHTDGRMQSVYRVNGDLSTHVTFGDRPEDKSRVWVTRINFGVYNNTEWLNGGPDEWRRVLGVPE